MPIRKPQLTSIKYYFPTNPGPDANPIIRAFRIDFPWAFPINSFSPKFLQIFQKNWQKNPKQSSGRTTPQENDTEAPRGPPTTVHGNFPHVNPSKFEQ